MADDPASPDATPPPVPRDEEEGQGRGGAGAAGEDDEEQLFATGATAGTAGAPGEGDDDEEADAMPEQSEFEALKQVSRESWDARPPPPQGARAPDAPTRRR